MSPGLRALDVALAATVLLEYGPRLETRPGAADPGGPGAGAGRRLDGLRLAGGPGAWRREGAAPDVMLESTLLDPEGPR